MGVEYSLACQLEVGLEHPFDSLATIFLCDLDIVGALLFHSLHYYSIVIHICVLSSLLGATDSNLFHCTDIQW